MSSDAYKKDELREPSFEEISSLLSGSLDSDRAAEVRSALLRDPELLRSALDVRNPEGLERVADLAPGASDRAWEKFRSKIEAEPPAGLRPGIGGDLDPRSPAEDAPIAVPRPAAETSRRLEPVPPRPRRWYLPSWRDAAVAVLGAGITMLGVSVWQRPGESLILEQLSPRDESRLQRGDETEPAKITPDADTEMLVLLLVPPASLSIEMPDPVRYRVARGDELLKSGILSQQDEGVFMLTIARRLLRPGSYTVRLSADVEAPILAEYDFSIAPKELASGDAEGARVGR